MKGLNGPPPPLKDFYFQGFLQWLSGSSRENVATCQKAVFFPGQDTDSPWRETTAVKRFPLWFSAYPFRGLTFRELQLARQLTGDSGNEFTSALIPAHVQFNFLFKRRTGSLLDLMLIDQLSPRYGSTKSVLTADERNLALKIGGVGLQPDAEHTIIDVQVQLKNIKLQVKHIERQKKKGSRSLTHFFVCARLCASNTKESIRNDR